MEIYKLSDEVPETRQGLTKKHKCDRIGVIASKDAGVSDAGGHNGRAGGEIAITEIRQAVRNENRVNVYVNGKYSFSLDVAQVVEMGVKVGRVVSAEELAELKKASEYGKAYQRALEWALMRPRSVRELRDYLRRRQRTKEMKERRREWEEERKLREKAANDGCGFAGEVQGVKQMRRKVERPKYDFDELIVSRLCERGYVDDGKFARYYVENRFVKKGVSPKRMRAELTARGVASEVIETVLAESGRDEVGEIQKMIAKKRAKYDDEKLIAYLCRQGFPYELANEQVRSCGKD